MKVYDKEACQKEMCECLSVHRWDQWRREVKRIIHGRNSEMNRRTKRFEPKLV